MPIERTLPEILAAAERQTLNDIKKVLPGVVTKVYDSVLGAPITVDVQLGINNVQFTDINDIVEEDAPSLSQVPLGYLRGGGFIVWIPVNVGDTVLVVFTDLSADTWRIGDGQPKTPNFVGKHTMSSGWAIPMIGLDAAFSTDIPQTPGVMIIGKDGADAQIRVSASTIELGATGADFVALASKVDANLSALVTYLTSHIHTVPSGPSAGPTTPPTVPPSPATPTASVIVRCD